MPCAKARSCVHNKTRENIANSRNKKNKSQYNCLDCNEVRRPFFQVSCSFPTANIHGDVKWKIYSSFSRIPVTSRSTFASEDSFTSRFLQCPLRGSSLFRLNFSRCHDLKCQLSSICVFFFVWSRTRSTWHLTLLLVYWCYNAINSLVQKIFADCLFPFPVFCQ